MNVRSYQPRTQNKGIEGRVFQMIIGFAIIIMGLGFLMHQAGWIEFSFNWWALFILLPAASFLFAAVHIYRQNGNRLTMAVATQGLLALVVGSLAIALLFGYYPPINWGAIWPLFIILTGLSILFGRPGR